MYEKDICCISFFVSVRAHKIITRFEYFYNESHILCKMHVAAG